jgi:predicted DNA-binding WGR domain protein
LEQQNEALNVYYDHFVKQSSHSIGQFSVQYFQQPEQVDDENTEDFISEKKNSFLMDATNKMH